MTIMNHVPNLMEPAKADELAATMNEDPEDDWRYVAVHDPKGAGQSFIAMYDEVGEKVGTL